jgi:RNA polymerase sigma-70 factor, ECF subfamily
MQNRYNLAVCLPMNYQSMPDEELVQECAKNSDPAAWEEFRQRFDRLIGIVVLRACRERGEKSLDIVQDLRQEIYVKLLANNCSLLARFKPQHPTAFLGYLKVVTANVVYDYLRSQRASIRDVDSTVELDEANQVQSSGHGHAELVENEIFFKEVDSLLRQRGTGPDEEKERTIFWLHFRHGLTCKEIASLPAMGLKMKGVESVIHRLKELLKEELV